MELLSELKLTPTIWLAIGFVLMGLEVLIPGFILFWFGIGAILTSFFAWFGIITNSQWQWIFFFLSSLFLLTLWFTVLKKVFKKETEDEYRDPTLVTLRGKVSKIIKPGIPGEVELYELYHGIKTWKADSDVEIQEDEEIIVEEASGIKLKVKKYTNNI